MTCGKKAWNFGTFLFYAWIMPRIRKKTSNHVLILLLRDSFHVDSDDINLGSSVNFLSSVLLFGELQVFLETSFGVSHHGHCAPCI